MKAFLRLLDLDMDLEVCRESEVSLLSEADALQEELREASRRSEDARLEATLRNRPQKLPATKDRTRKIRKKKGKNSEK